MSLICRTLLNIVSKILFYFTFALGYFEILILSFSLLSINKRMLNHFFSLNQKNTKDFFPLFCVLSFFKYNQKIILFLIS